MLKFDAVVVGAGPAGSTAARVIAATGARVLLVEKKARVGCPVQCAEYVPALISLEVELTAAAIAQPVQTLVTLFPDGSRTLTSAPGYILNREIFDSTLAEAAVRAGTELWLQARVVDLKDDILVIQREGERLKVKAALIIGADGPLSPVARLSGWPRQPLAVAAQLEVVLPEKLENTRVYFDPLYRGGYAWVFPKGKTANVGVGFIPGDLTPPQALQHFLGRLGWQGQKVMRRTGGYIPTGGPYPEVHRGMVLLCGDAGGFTHPVTGAGILTAVLSGRLAGEAGSDYLSRGTSLTSYETSWRGLLGKTMARAVNSRQHWQAEWSMDNYCLTKLLSKTWF
ncbi:MAG: hypothetical protein PWQ18_1158 [Clostridia bacterium]|nr:hypothetical protein [Clostridia bacterium]